MTTEQKAKAWDMMEGTVIEVYNNAVWNDLEDIKRISSAMIITMAKTRHAIEREE